MAIANLQEMLLSYTKQETAVNEKLSTVMMNTASATRSYASKQQQYNEQVQNYYYEYYDSEDQTLYQEITEQLQKDREYELANLNSWESTSFVEWKEWKAIMLLSCWRTVTFRFESSTGSRESPCPSSVSMTRE